MKNFFKKTGMTIGIFLLTVLLGFGLICTVYSLPGDTRRALHVRESGDSLVQQGNYWQLIPGRSTTMLDNFTDCIMLLTAAYSGDESAVDQAVKNYRIYQKKATKQESCQNCGILPTKKQKKLTYERYWHGYLVVLRPLLLFFNLGEIQQLNSLVILIYMVLISILLYRRKKRGYIIPYLLACTYMTPMTISVSLQNSTVFHTASIALIVLLICYDKKWFQNNIWIYFMLTGMLTSYVDFLTYPVVALAFPLIFYFILDQENTPLKNLWHMIFYSGMWAVGYVGMWASKWCLATIITGNNYFTDASEAISVRSGTTVGDVTISFNDVFQCLRGYTQNNIVYKLSLLFAVLCVVILIFCKRCWNRWSVSLIFLLVCVYPYIWAFGAKNHTYMHIMFTHRILSVVVLGISCAVLPLIGSRHSKVHTISVQKNS